MPELTAAWKCSYCNRTSMSRSSILRHEKKYCAKNRSCQLCEKFTRERETDDFGLEGWAYYCGYDELEVLQNNCERFKPKEKP